MRLRPKESLVQRVMKRSHLLGLALFVMYLALVIGRWAVTQQPHDLAAPAPGKPKDEAAQFWQNAMNVGETAALRPTTGTEFTRGNITKKEVALTFDDGPTKEITPQLLAVLKWYRVKATFFLVGSRVETYPELVKAEMSEGHCLGNHTYHHDHLTQLGSAGFSLEIRDCSAAIERVTGHSPRFFRPPGGNFDAQVTRAAEQLGCRTILWTTNTNDFRRPDSGIIEARAVAGAKNGAILLLHDGVQQTVDALPSIIEDLRARGYKFVTIDEMVKGAAK